MLAVVSRACSIVHSIAIYIRTRRAGLPRQCQPRSGRGCADHPATCRLLGSERRSRRGPCVPKKEATAEQQRRGQCDAGQESCITMEVIVNAVMLSTDRAWTGFEIIPDRNASKAYHVNGKRALKCPVLWKLFLRTLVFSTCLVASHVEKT